MTDTSGVAASVIHWFRRDLRLQDNTALHHALLAGDPVVPVFILDDYILARGVDAERLRLLRSALVDLDNRLVERGSRLVVRRGDAARELNRLAQEMQSWGVYFNRDYTPYARQRDTRATRGLQLTGVVTQAFDDRLLVAPLAIQDAEGASPTTIDAFLERWLAVLDVQADPLENPDGGQFMAREQLPGSFSAWQDELAPGTPLVSAVTAATPAEARERLRRFVADSLAGYGHAERDDAELSGIWVALDLGTLSAREVARAVLRRGARDPRARPGAERLMRQLARREFAVHELFRHPGGRPAAEMNPLT